MAEAKAKKTASTTAKASKTAPAKKSSASQASRLNVTLVRSAIRRPQDQNATLVGLGLTRMHKTVSLEDTPSIRGMVNKVSHLVRVEDAK